MEVTGEAPEGGLSGLAVAMLNAMLHCLEVHDDVESQCRQRMLKSPEVRAILEGEDPEMVIAYLDWKAKEGGALYTLTDLERASRRLLARPMEDKRSIGF